jgi:hypothetical protein
MVFWSNYDNLEVDFPVISPSFIPPLLVKAVGLELPLFYRFLDEFSHNLPGYGLNVKVDSNHQVVGFTPESMLEMEEMYKLLQYDILFGEQYIFQDDILVE